MTHWRTENVQHRKDFEASRRYRNREYIQEAKNKPCTDCGIRYPFYVMDFDHVRGEKRVNLSMMGNRGYSIESIQTEIEKCEVVCANCHRERTSGG